MYYQLYHLIFYLSLIPSLHPPDIPSHLSILLPIHFIILSSSIHYPTSSSTTYLNIPSFHLPSPPQPHKTILDKYGMPDDLMVGILDLHEDVLPPVPLYGMYNKSGGKVRLTFKLDLDQLWIGTKGFLVSFVFFQK